MRHLQPCMAAPKGCPPANRPPNQALTLAGAAAHLLGQRVAQRVQLSGALVRQELVQGRVQQADGHCEEEGREAGHLSNATCKHTLTRINCTNWLHGLSAGLQRSHQSAAHGLHAGEQRPPLTRQAVHGGEDALKVLALELLERSQRVRGAGALRQAKQGSLQSRLQVRRRRMGAVHAS